MKIIKIIFLIIIGAAILGAGTALAYGYFVGAKNIKSAVLSTKGVNQIKNFILNLDNPVILGTTQSIGGKVKEISKSRLVLEEKGRTAEFQLATGNLRLTKVKNNALKQYLPTEIKNLPLPQTINLEDIKLGSTVSGVVDITALGSFVVSLAVFENR